MSCNCLRFIRNLAKEWERDYNWKTMGMSNTEHFVRRRVKNETISWVADQLEASQQSNSADPKIDCERCGEPMTQVFKCFRCPEIRLPGR